MILFNLDFYFLICLIFCTYNLRNLIIDGRKFVYQNSEFDVNTTHFSLCIILESKSYNCWRIDQVANSSMHDACMKLRKLSKYFESSERTPKEIINKAKEFKVEEFFSFKDRITVAKKFYYLNFQSICIAYTAENIKRLNNEPTYINIPFINRYSIESKILFHGSEPYPIITRGYMFECIQFDYCPSFAITIMMYDQKLLPAPFSSKCVDYSKMKFKFEKYEKIRSRSDCIMECMKANHRLSLFFYSEKDNDILKFNPKFPLTNEIKVDYQKCLSTCSNFDCLTRNFFVYGYKHDYEKEHSVVRHHYQAMYYEAIPYLYRYSFALQFLGFIALVFGTSVFTLLFKLRLHFKNNLALKSVFKIQDKTILFIKRAMFVICFLIGAFLELQYYRTYQSDLNYSHIFRAYTPIYPTGYL